METRKGDRVRLIRSEDSYTGLQPGTEGTVQMVDSVGTVHVQWDTGEQLGLIEGKDAWEVRATVHQHDDRAVTIRVPEVTYGQMYMTIDKANLEAVRDAVQRAIDGANDEYRVP